MASAKALLALRDIFQRDMSQPVDTDEISIEMRQFPGAYLRVCNVIRNGGIVDESTAHSFEVGLDTLIKLIDVLQEHKINLSSRDNNHNNNLYWDTREIGLGYSWREVGGLGAFRHKKLQLLRLKAHWRRRVEKRNNK
jgi:hypothetical protein